MFRVYLRSPEGVVLSGSKTSTENLAEAVAAFEELVNRGDLDGSPYAAALTYNHMQIAYHRFERQLGQPDNWRNRMNDLPLHIAQGHKGRSVGRTQFVTVRLEIPILLRATEIGGGDLSNGLKLAVRQYQEAAMEAFAT